MTINVIDVARDTSAPPRSGDQTLLLLLAAQGARGIQTHAQEEAAIDAEDFWTQSEEANAIDPIG
jgi:hypothetical protein